MQVLLSRSETEQWHDADLGAREKFQNDLRTSLRESARLRGKTYVEIFSAAGVALGRVTV